MSLDMKLMIKETRETMADVRALCEILGRAAVKMLSDDQLPPDLLQRRKKSA